MAPARSEIDLAELEKLSALQCTDEEIAAWFNVSTRTIERRRKEKSFVEVMERGKARGRVSIRRMQMKLLEEGNGTMGVWLGKNVLGQADQVFHQFHTQVTHVMIMPGPSGDKRAARPTLENRVIDVECDEVDAVPGAQATRPFRR